MSVWRLSVRALAVLCVMVTGVSLASATANAKEYVLGTVFGSEGSGNGQFKEPTGVAVNDSSEVLVQPAVGDLYVIDTGNARVQRFSADGTYISQWDGTATLAKNFSFSRENDSQGIAVDSSTNPLDPSEGDVYVADVGHGVIDQFNAEGVFTGLELFGTCAAPGTCPGKELPFIGELRGIAVDTSGNLWVYESEGNIDEFSDSGAFVSSFNTGRRTEDGLAVDASDNLYPVFGDSGAGKYEGETQVAEFGTNVKALTINTLTSEVLLNKGSGIERFGAIVEPGQSPLEDFASMELTESYGITVNGSSEKQPVYATQRSLDNVEIFNYVLAPSVSTERATEVTTASAILHGSINPKGKTVKECSFEYGTATIYRDKVPCEQTPADIGSGSGPVAVSAEVTGLQPGATYHFRLDAANAEGAVRGSDEEFVQFPTLEDPSVSNLGSTEATVSAQIDAGGVDTSYRVEYGTTKGYGLSTPEANVGALSGSVSVLTRLEGLQAGTEYHFRFVTTSTYGTDHGAEMSFTTRTDSVAALMLPDSRAYELVSAPEDAEVYQPPHEHDAEDSPAGEYQGVADKYRAAANGEAVVYMGDPPASGVGGSGETSSGSGNQYMATRAAKGWETNDLSFPFPAYEFSPLSADLSVLTFSTEGQVTANPQKPGECETTSYSQDSSGYHALVTASQIPGQCAAVPAAISADDSHILFYSPYSYTDQAKEGIKAGKEHNFAVGEEDNLYDSVNGQLHQINVLPSGEPEPHPDAAFGSISKPGEDSYRDFEGVVSADGSRVIWEDLNSEVTTEDPDGTSRLFVRKNGTQPQSPLGPKGECTVAADACTVQIDAVQGGSGPGGDGQFRAAGGDDSRVFFTDENKLTQDSTAAPGEPDLYEYDVDTGVLSDLSFTKIGTHANVQGVAGVSEDGSYAYFVADGVLALSANVQGDRPVSGQPNLYLFHDGTVSFIATLEVEDDSFPISADLALKSGDWVLEPGERTSEVAPNGQAVTFMSRRSLTGYDNAGCQVEPHGSCPEVFVYEAGSGQLACASCNPSGAPLVPAAEPWEDERGGTVGMSGSHSHQLRFINKDGTRVFFMTSQPLVSQDTNHHQDLYEWESDGSNGCGLTAGCVAPLSSVSSPKAALFVDASASGDDVFFTSRAQLVPSAVDEGVKLYDARVDGGFPEVSLACTGTGCQGVPPAPPIFATPSSVTFNGVGNFEAATPGKTIKSKHKTTAQVRVEKLANALKVCRKKAKRKRSVCEKRAHKLYGTATKRGER